MKHLWPRSSSWVPQGSYLESNRDECTVSLIYAVHLKKQGSVSFEYQYRDNNLLFEFFVSWKQLLCFYFCLPIDLFVWSVKWMLSICVLSGKHWKWSLLMIILHMYIKQRAWYIFVLWLLLWINVQHSEGFLYEAVIPLHDSSSSVVSWGLPWPHISSVVCLWYYIC